MGALSPVTQVLLARLQFERPGKSITGVHFTIRRRLSIAADDAYHTTCIVLHTKAVPQ
jgi:hypothetical protein